MLSAAMFLFAMLLISLGESSGVLETETLLVRKIEVAMPPPSHPPPPVSRTNLANVSEPSIELNVDGVGPAVLSIKPRAEQALALSKPALPTFEASVPTNADFEVNWDAVSLSDLDGLPQLLTPLRAKFPKSLVRAGVKKAKVKLDVLIDEQGHVSLIDILENSHPELDVEISRIVRASRFSIPKKEDTAVRARFIWPVEFKS